MQQRKRTRIFALIGAVALAAAVVVVIVLASGGDDPPAKQAGEKVAGERETSALFRAIPQRGAVLGDPDASVTVVEFADLQCPFCKQASDEVVPEIVERYVRSGRAKLVFRDVAFLGDDSLRGGQLAAAAGRQDRMWQFVHLFYVNQGTENSGYVTDDFLRSIAGGVAGLDVEQAWAERGDASYQAGVDEARQRWTELFGPQPGTPAFAVGPDERSLTALEGDATAEAIGAAIERTR